MSETIASEDFDRRLRVLFSVTLANSLLALLAVAGVMYLLLIDTGLQGDTSPAPSTASSASGASSASSAASSAPPVTGSAGSAATALGEAPKLREPRIPMVSTTASAAGTVVEETLGAAPPLRQPFVPVVGKAVESGSGLSMLAPLPEPQRPGTGSGTGSSAAASPAGTVLPPLRKPQLPAIIIAPDLEKTDGSPADAGSMPLSWRRAVMDERDLKLHLDSSGLQSLQSPQDLPEAKEEE